MADLIKQLYKKNDSTTKIFPNIKSENIPPSSVSLAKLTSDIQATLNDVSNKLNATKLDSLLTSIKTNLASYGIDFTYSFENDAWTISFDNVEQQFECEYLWDFVVQKVKYQRMGNHIVGYLELEVTQQITANEELLILDHQSEWTGFDTRMMAWKNDTPCVALIDENGAIKVNVGLDEFDVLTIRLDWWV